MTLLNENTHAGAGPSSVPDPAAHDGLDRDEDGMPLAYRSGIQRFLGVELPGRGTNYLKQELVYLKPARLDETLTARVTITRLRPEKHLCDLETILTDARGKVLATGRALVFVRDVSAA